MLRILYRSVGTELCLKPVDRLKECWFSYCFFAWSVYFVWYTIKIDIRPRLVSIFSDPVLSGHLY